MLISELITQELIALESAAEAAETNIKTLITGVYNVLGYGAVGNGLKDNTDAFQSALDDAFLNGGGIVYVPPGRYRFDSVITVPSNVHLTSFFNYIPEVAYQDNITGISLSNIKTAVFLIYNTAEPFIRLRGVSPGVSGIIFYYPDQVSPTTSTPTIYPPTISLYELAEEISDNPTVMNCFFVNSYHAIKLERAHNRARIKDCYIGCYKDGITIDYTTDTDRLENIHIIPFYDTAVGLNYPQAIDTWIKTNGNGITIRRADWVVLSNIIMYHRKIGFLLVDTANTDWSPRNSNGLGVNIGLDQVDIGFYIKSTQAYGWDFQNVNITCFSDSTNRAAISFQPDGISPPVARFDGGAVWGDNNSIATLSSGDFSISNFRFINDSVYGIAVADATNVTGFKVRDCDFIGNAGISLLNSMAGRVFLSGNDLRIASFIEPNPLPVKYRAYGNIGITDGTNG